MSDNNLTYVAVHGGAGNHSRSSDKEVKQALRRACKQSIASLMNGSTALSAVVEAITVLEDDPNLNAGCGSNLTLNGTVECDAAVMDGRTGDFGSAGAVSGIKNPVELARAILDHSRTPDPLGRLPPMTLVSDGARLFAASKNIPTAAPEELATPRAYEEWQKWKGLYESSADNKSGPIDLHNIQDTVGAVTWASGGDLAAGVSSGGLLLKYPGRIGEAALFGAGCWAKQSSNHGMACSMSGAGEQITRSMLAKALGDALNNPGVDVHDVLETLLIEGFWDPCRERGEREPNAGILLITQEEGDDGKLFPRLWCAFTTASMAIAYASLKDPVPKAMVLRHPEPTQTNGNPNLFITALSF